MHQISGLYIAERYPQGRGVYTSHDIDEGDLIEVCQVIRIPREELPIIHKTVLHDYYFLWGEAQDECVIALGFGSLYNHRVYPNAEFIFDYDHQTIDFIARRPIKSGEEITVNYHGEAGDQSPCWWDEPDTKSDKE